MSIIRKPYIISVWDDVWDSVEGKFVEKRLGIIGSDKMETQSRVIEPELVRNTNGTRTLTFKLYKRYIDNITGELVYNPFYDWLVNERKVKLNLDGVWYDFLVKNIQESSTDYLCVYQLEDALVQELSKNGFNIELNNELGENSGTAKELATKVLCETNWSVDSDKFVERVEEALVWLKTPNREIKATIVSDDNIEPCGTVTFNGSAEILAFYSSCTSKPYRFQFIYATGVPGKNDTLIDRLTKDENRLITNSNCQLYIDNLTYSTTADATYGFYLPDGFEIASVSETKDSSQIGRAHV